MDDAQAMLDAVRKAREAHEQERKDMQPFVESAIRQNAVLRGIPTQHAEIAVREVIEKLQREGYMGRPMKRKKVTR